MNSDLADFYLGQLLDDCLPFWFPRAHDELHGGFLHAFDRNGELLDSDKSVWAQGRMSWMLLVLYLEHERRPEWLEWAQSGLDFLDQHCVDPDDGRLFFHVARDGTPLRKRRYNFSESFASIAFAAHAAATGSNTSADRAMKLFRTFVDWNFTPGRMPPKFTGTRPAIGLGPRMMTVVTAQELSLRLGESEELTGWIDRAIQEITNLFFHQNIGAVLEQVTPEGELIDHFDGRLLNPGHAIEAAWFLLEEARRREDEDLRKIACRMLDVSWQRGWDEEFGGLLYFRDVNGGPVQEYWHDMKFWWPHDEALIATLLAYSMTGEKRYLEWHELCRQWAFKHFSDQEYGGWYGYLHRDGRLSVPLKGNMWKAFFHHPRALWTCYRLAGGKTL